MNRYSNWADYFNVLKDHHVPGATLCLISQLDNFLTIKPFFYCPCDADHSNLHMVSLQAFRMEEEYVQNLLRIGYELESLNKDYDHRNRQEYTYMFKLTERFVNNQDCYKIRQ